MATKAWDVDLSGVSHYVDLDHGTMIGKRTINDRGEDGVIVEKGTSFRFRRRYRLTGPDIRRSVKSARPDFSLIDEGERSRRPATLTPCETTFLLARSVPVANCVCVQYGKLKATHKREAFSECQMHG